MRITVRFYASLRTFVGKEELSLDLAEGSTIRDLLGTLTQAYGPGFEEARTRDPFEAYVKADGVNPAILVNGRSIDPEKDLSERLSDGDLVVIMPMMASG